MRNHDVGREASPQRTTGEETSLGTATGIRITKGEEMTGTLLVDMMIEAMTGGGIDQLGKA